MPRSVPVSVRLNAETYRLARELARRTSRSLSAIVSELAEEAFRMRRHPGIAFAGPPGDRRARVEGTGLDVWEVIAVYRACREDIDRTRRALEHVTPRQIEAALRYYRAYPEEIDALVAENERPREEWERLYPHLAPLSG
jgi:uncharacterized protein (DUF433 family)